MTCIASNSATRGMVLSNFLHHRTVYVVSFLNAGMSPDTWPMIWCTQQAPGFRTIPTSCVDGKTPFQALTVAFHLSRYGLNTKWPQPAVLVKTETAKHQERGSATPSVAMAPAKELFACRVPPYLDLRTGLFGPDLEGHHRFRV